AEAVRRLFQSSNPCRSRRQPSNRELAVRRHPARPTRHRTELRAPPPFVRLAFLFGNVAVPLWTPSAVRNSRSTAQRLGGPATGRQRRPPHAQVRSAACLQNLPVRPIPRWRAR